MKIKFTAPRGTQDSLPAESGRLRTVENMMMDTARCYGFGEIRTPVFEATELFDRGVGETTDVVQKEMYTFEDNGHRSVTLRPEGTAGVVRAFIEHGLFNEPMPQRFSYITSCYRYEKPQAGRLREFHQFGVEYFGAADASADAEVIGLARHFFDILELDGIELRINSIGCAECRKDFQNALREYFGAHIDELCDTCKGRLDRNPMRILDCKNPPCHALADGAPVVLDFLCAGCRDHFDALKVDLDLLGIDYTVDPTIVRGLDYYTRTVFEFVSTGVGAQGTVCGGGRYDGLVELLGGPATPALGFGLGLERLCMLLDANDRNVGSPECNIFLAAVDGEARALALKLVSDLRYADVCASVDTLGRSLKAQMKYADKIGAEFTAVIGSRELETGLIGVKRMATGDVIELPVEDFDAEFIKAYIALLSSDFEGAENE